MQRRKFLVATGAAALTSLAGCGGGNNTPTPDPADIGAEVTITEDGFDPLRVEVEPGKTVRWTNESGDDRRVEANTAAADSSSWDFSAELEDGESAAHTFEEGGIYSYHEAIATRFQMCGAVAVDQSADDVSGLPCE